VNVLNAQTKEPETKITLKVQNQPVYEVLKAITLQTGVRFSYSTDVFDVKKKISINIVNEDLNNVLKKIFPSSIDYRQVGKHIIIQSVDEKISGLSKNTLYASVMNPELDIIQKQGKNLEHKDLIYKKYENNYKKIPILNTGIIDNNCHNIENIKIENKMKKYITALLAGTVMAGVATGQNNTTDTVKVDVLSPRIECVGENDFAGEENIRNSRIGQFTFFYPLGTDGKSSKVYTYNFSLNVLGGITAQTNGFELGAIFNINKYGSKGLQTAGIFNFTGSDACNAVESNNFQIAGFANHTRKGSSSQIAGVFNFAENSPVQIGSIINSAKKSGCQISGIFNNSLESICQVSGAVNSSEKSYFQIGGLVNIARPCSFDEDEQPETKPVTQISGAINIAAESTCQIGGIVNVTKKGGFQLGLVNIRDTADGISIGLINIVKKGGLIEFGVEAGEFLYPVLTFRSGTDKFYTILTGTYKFSKTNDFWSVGYGLGTKFNISKNFGLDLELIYNDLFFTKSTDYEDYLIIIPATDGTSASLSILPEKIEKKNNNSLIQLSPVFTYKFAKNFKIFAGPSFNLLIQTLDEIYYPEYIYLPEDPSLNARIKTPYTIFQKTKENCMLSFWIGFRAGIKF
jgi:hypothetical protein